MHLLERLNKFLVTGIIKRALEINEADPKVLQENLRLETIRRSKVRYFWSQVISCSRHMERMKLTPLEIVRKCVFPAFAYSRIGSRDLINAAKSGDVQYAEGLLQKNRYLVYDYDPTHQTALHWAAKRNQPEMIELLIGYGCHINAKDIGNRTALFIASKNGYIKWVKALLAGEANPMIRTHKNLSPLEVAKDAVVESYIRKAYLLFILMRFLNKAKAKDVWRKEGLYYFTNKSDNEIPL